LDRAAKQKLQEWEVPFDFPADWPEAARKPFDSFHAARQAIQKQMDFSIASHAEQETLYDQPQVAKNKMRITGPFTVEAVPFPTVLALDEGKHPQEADVAIARSGESARQHTWRDELLKTGIRGKGGHVARFAELETLPGTQYLHASGTLADSGERVVVSFGPEHAALEQRQVAMALNEAEKLRPAPKFIVFCAFTFDPEAAKDIDETNWPGVTLLKAQMNTDLLTEDLKKSRASNQSFWLMGQPDVQVHKLKDGKYQVEVHGFDYFNTKSGELESGGKGKIAVWLLDTDYDERSLFPRQVFFPLSGKGEGWEKLKKNIRAELDESLLDKFHGTKSLPFEAGENRKVAVKIVDDRGIESLKIISLE
jgi:adenine-specific DNA-methyltransferase